MTPPGIPPWLFSPTLLAFTAVYFFQARKAGRYPALAFLVLLPYGFAVEYFNLRATHEYFYADMWFMLGTPPNWVPLAVCGSWAVLITLAMRTSDRLGLPWGQRPFVDGLIAVVFDLVADPVASRSRMVPSLAENCLASDAPLTGGLGVWTWCVLDTDPTWIGIPLPNYIFWFLVVFFASLGIRIGRRRFQAPERSGLTQLGILSVGVVLALVGVMSGLLAYNALLHERPFASAVVLVGILLIPGVILFRQWRFLRRDHPLDWLTLAMPVVALTGAMGFFLVLQIDAPEWPIWVVLLLACYAMSLALWFLPYSETLRDRLHSWVHNSETS